MLISWKDSADFSCWSISGKAELIHGICSQHLLWWPRVAGSQGKRARAKTLQSPQLPNLFHAGTQPLFTTQVEKREVHVPLLLNSLSAQQVGCGKGGAIERKEETG